MSYISQVVQCAPEIQDSLNNNFNTGNSTLLEPLPFLEFLASNANNKGLKQKINPSPNKTKTVELTYMQRLLDSDIDSNGNNNVCSGGDTLGNLLTTYSIDTTQNRYKTQLIDSDDLQCMDQDFVSYMSAQIGRLLDGVERAVSVKSASESVALIGNWAADAVSTYTITSDILSIDDSDVKNFHKISTAADMTGYGAQKAIFGGAQLRDFMSYAKAGCCTSNGLDIGSLWAQFGIAFLYDRHVTDALGGHANGLLTQPGSLALLTFNKAGWKNGLPVVNQGANYVQLPIVSPRTGLAYDVTITDNCGNITIHVVGTTKVVGLPTDMWSTNDNFDGVTFVNKLRIV